MTINRETKKHVIDGVTYVEVDRKAEVGDKVLVFGTNICEIIDVWDVNAEAFKLKSPSGMELQSWFDVECLRVLEPVQTEASPQILDLLASLSRKIVSLESQLRDTQGNVEKLSHELAEVNHLTVRNENDIADIDARIIEFGDTSKSGAKLLAEAFAALARYEEARR